MALSKDLVGTKLQDYTVTVERGKIKEFCKAIGETNPIYLDPEAAKAAGYEDTPIPPTFQTTFVFWGYESFWEDVSSMEIDIKKLLHMKEEYKYLKPIYPGTTIHASGGVTDVKISGKLDTVAFTTTYKDDKGDPCIEAEMAIMIPKG